VLGANTIGSGRVVRKRTRLSKASGIRYSSIMPGVKITSFLGIAPKVSPELLPETAGQIARNAKIYSGDLIPYPAPVVIGNTGRTGVIRTLFALKDNLGQNQWLSWLTDVDIAVVTSSDIDDQRFYYTGDGVPKVSNFTLATNGAAPYPIDYYDLGLPLPKDKPTITVVPFTTVSTATYERDANNTAVLTTTGPHGLKDGAYITITGFTYLAGTYTYVGTTVTCTVANHGLANNTQVSLNFTSGNAVDGTYTVTVTGPNTFTVIVGVAPTSTGTVRLSMESFNASGVRITVLDAETFEYFSPGPQVSTTAFVTGKIDLGGPTQSRSYVYTWFTPWEEESIGSDPTTDVFVKEGVTITVSDLPDFKPAGNNFVRGIRLYRTLATSAGTEYFRLKTLWFPTDIVSVSRAANVSTVTLIYPHNLGIDDRFKISGCDGDASFNINGGIVTAIVDDYTFRYAQTGANVSPAIFVGGTMYVDVCENQELDPARYWGDGGNFDFIDDFDPLNLSDILASDEYDAPPSDLKGLIAAQNNILAGFTANKLYLSEPARPHAWPQSYAITFEYDIVGLASVNGAILVLTEGYPYYISGNDPAAGLSSVRIDALYPCLNSKGIVPMNYGVVWPTHDGMAVYSPSSGPQLATKANFNNDTWAEALDPSTIVGEFYGDAYLASHSTGGFTFEPVERVGGQYVTIDYTFTSSWYSPTEGRLYYTFGTNGDIYEWDNLAQPSVPMEWKSKVIKTTSPMNLGAARVIADFEEPTLTWNQNTALWNADQSLWSTSDNILFSLWVDKELLFTHTVTDMDTFRLPTGYRSDTFEVAVEGDIRVRAIHLGETPLSLKDA
jgi:hypothetical protein